MFWDKNIPRTKKLPGSKFPRHNTKRNRNVPVPKCLLTEMSRDVNGPGTEMSLGQSIIGLKFTACETSLQKCPVVEIISDKNVRGPMYPETNCSEAKFF